MQAFYVGSTPSVALYRSAQKGLMRGRTSLGGGKRALFGQTCIALRTKGDQTRDPATRAFILWSDGKKRDSVRQTITPTRQCICRPTRTRVPQVKSAVEARAFGLLNEHLYAIVGIPDPQPR